MFSQSFHANEMDDRPDCLFFLVVYDATYQLVISGQGDSRGRGAGPHGASRFAASRAVMPDALVGSGKQSRATSVKSDFGGGNLVHRGGRV